MSTLRRTMVLLVVLFVAPVSAAPDKKEADSPRKPKDRARPLSAGLEVFPELPQLRLVAAKDSIHRENWEKATAILQKLLARPDIPVFVERRQGTKKKLVWVGSHTEARRLLANLPRKGRAYYQAAYGRKAEEMLAEARKNQDLALYQQVIRQYLFTDAGLEALEALARSHLDRGDSLKAASAYALLVHHQGLARWAPEELYRVALTLRRAGFRDTAATVERALWQRIGEEDLRVGAKTYTAAQLRQALAPKATQHEDWPIFRADVARTNTGQAAIPFLRPQWAVESFYEKDKEGPRWVQQALGKIRKQKQPELTAFFPILVKWNGAKEGKDRRLVVFRSYYGIHSLNPETGKIRWQQPLSWSLQGMFLGDNDEDEITAGDRKRQAIDTWMTYYLASNLRPGSLFENSLIGTLSSDSQLVYVVEDVPVPPLPGSTAKLWVLLEEKKGWDFNATGPFVKAAILQNRLQAYRLDADGKLGWELNDPDEKGELKGSFFLGPPLPLEDRIYCLTEKKKELILVCIDPVGLPYGSFFKPKILWALPLAHVRTPLELDPIRRLWAAPLAYADGMLIVPTNAGAVFGIDLLTHSIAWVRPYRWNSAPLPPISWRASAPVVQDGRILLAAPDSEELVCLALKDGSVRWSLPRRKDDLYLAGVFQGRVVVVGRQKTRGLSLATGKTLWEVETGEPTGQGVADSTHFYLPVASVGDRPGLCVLDVVKGGIVARMSMRGKKPAEPLGNLLFYRDRLFSQTPTGLVAYPSLEATLRQLDK